ncbi:unnamed protein product, partial [Leptidea sinapis]
MVHLISMWWPPQTSIAATLHSITFLSLAALTLYFFLQSLLEGPGYVPKGWKPKDEEDVEFLQYCVICGRCILKMDHHCPWINCCVGHKNHGYFTIFLGFAVLGCFHASIVLVTCLYHGIHRVWYMYNGTGQEPIIYLTLTTLLLTLLATGMAIRGILRNRTTIEDWIMEKAICRREEQGLNPFVYPYDLGWKWNLRAVLWGPRSDGLTWPLVEGCHEYDLTGFQRYDQG